MTREDVRFGEIRRLSSAGMLFLFMVVMVQGTYGRLPEGGNPQFEVASVRQHSPSSSPAADLPNSNFPLNATDAYVEDGGLFSAVNYRLDVYIAFAYKLLPSQTQSVLAQLPKWALTDHFDIQARANAGVTKDQMRLMMQSLLADRFKLTVHTKAQQMAVYAVELERPDRTGPQLQPHTAASPSCDTTATGASGNVPDVFPDGLPAACGVLQTKFESGRLRVGARNVSIDFIESYFPGRSMGNFDRPVVDKTGLSGNFDFILEWVPEELNLNGAKVAVDPNGPSFLEALKDQLGLKLTSTTAAVQTLIVDHLEQPSQN